MDKNKGRNVTLYMPRDLIRKAKINAVKEDKSLSEFMKEALEDKMKKDLGYNKAKKRQLRMIKKGINLGTNGIISASRSELHERK
ncbi:MAG: CopG family transcriptional regulator [Acidobacteriota bacterium]